MIKKVILVLNILCGLSLDNFAQFNTPKNIEPKKVWFNLGVGTSIRMGTLLFPSVDAFADAGPITIEGFWKYVNHSETELSMFGLGCNLHFFKLGYASTIFASYFYAWDSEWESQKNPGRSYFILITDENIFCLGLQGKINNHIQFYFRFGVAFAVNPDFKDKWDPRMEIGFKIPVRKLEYKQISLF